MNLRHGLKYKSTASSLEESTELSIFSPLPRMKFEQSALTALLSASLAYASPPAPQPSSCSTDITPNDFNSTCASIASNLEVENGVVYFSQFVAAGTNLSLSDNNATCAQAFQLVTADICRISLYVSTSDHSGFNMEAWLPSNWTGRYLSTGTIRHREDIEVHWLTF